MPSSYVIALGSNRRGRHGMPADEVRAALTALPAIGGDVVMTSPLITTAPLGPARRRFVNAAALVESDDTPPEMLARLKAIEMAFGRRRGQRWTDRVIDLDIILWSGGAWASDGLTVPHPEFRRRDFVRRPLVAIVPHWRDPVTRLTIRQLAARSG